LRDWIKRDKRRKIDRRLSENIIELMFYFVKRQNVNISCPAARVKDRSGQG